VGGVFLVKHDYLDIHSTGTSTGSVQVCTTTLLRTNTSTSSIKKGAFNNNLFMVCNLIAADCLLITVCYSYEVSSFLVLLCLLNRFSASVE